MNSLFKYTRLDGVDILHNLRIKVSGALSLNDPFEFLLSVPELTSAKVKDAVFTKDVLRKYYDNLVSKGRCSGSFKDFKRANTKPKVRNKISQKMASELTDKIRKMHDYQRKNTDLYFRIACFCGIKNDIANSCFNEILMWSHYSNGHKGLRFLLDVKALQIQEGALDKVEYRKERVAYDILGYIRREEQVIQQAINESLKVKSFAWAYEDEYRWFVHPSLQFKDAGNYYVKIDPKAIVGIDFGVNCSDTEIDSIVTLVKNKAHFNINLRRAEIDQNQFKLNYIKL